MCIEFNQGQLEAINAHKGAYAVISSAGSGKSTVLIHRIKTLVEKYNVIQKDILAISFTRNTADELKRKLSKLGLDNVNVGTFHSICLRIFNQLGMNINVDNLIPQWKVEKVIKDINKSANVDDIMSWIGYQKNYMLSPTSKEFMDKDSKYSENELRKYFRAYETYKKNNELYDMDDWLIECHELMQTKRITFDYVLVDEHQDSNLCQNLLLKDWCVSGNIFALFDFRQAIYSFRGANPEYCMNFHNDWENSKIINLDINYRSTNNIVNYANNFISNYYKDYIHYSDAVAHNKMHGHVELNTYDNDCMEGSEVADKIKNLIDNGENPSNIAVLYRLNKNSSYIETELKKKNIEYVVSSEGSFFKRTEVSAIISYLRLLTDLNDDMAFESIFKLRNYPLNYFSNDVYKDIGKYAKNKNISMYEALISKKYDKSWQGNNVSTFRNNINRLKYLIENLNTIENDNVNNIDTLINSIVDLFQIKNYLSDKYQDDELKDRLRSFDTIKLLIKTNGNSIDKFLSFVENGSNDFTKGKKKKSNAVQLMTIHASKGLEFDNVFLISLENGKFPHEKSDLQSEARLMYVAVTRAKENLWISGFGKNTFMEEYQLGMINDNDEVINDSNINNIINISNDKLLFVS